MSPNIPLTTPIASSMNVSGLNIDVGNPMAQTSSTWSIPNISITQIPPNPTNTQMTVSEGPGNTPEISSKANPQSQYSDKDFSSLPAPSRTEDHEIEIQVAGHLGYVPKDVFNEPLTQFQSQDVQSYCKNELHKLQLKQFTWDWESLWQHPFNKLMSMMFYHNFRLALVSTKYHHDFWNKDHNNYRVVAALME
ncbi:hypothetical protein O181_025740 [Austropuccinia psidii MF-1]|uniref:Uncharacterized protein n=1 Tax=Austropuccinia psidii MF-1 TaxID=1389203 RepID=A0A9Q3H1H2_9BASI|nr:hypothetical protein [Austropuccinia psidii MF-1]